MRSTRSRRASPKVWRSDKQGAAPVGWLIAAAVAVLAVVVVTASTLLSARNPRDTALITFVVAAIMLIPPLLQRQRHKTTSDAADERPLPRDRTEMLNRVRHYWIDGVLERSLDNQARITLRLTRWPRDHMPQPLPAGTTVSEVFNDVGGLLILGPPGSGKTTTLLELARDLLNKADQDPEQPIPVVFNLSSWAQHQLPFADWLVNELGDSYDVPRQTAQVWVDADDILPLLDGLDEVAAPSRTACVTEINKFLAERKHFAKLVVCSGTQEYESLPTRLGLEDAVELQPLTRQQVSDYLKAVGAPLANVRAALEADDRLWKLLASPLMLNLVTLAYQGQTADTLPVASALEQGQLFAVYVERMLERRPLRGRRHTKNQAIRWLSWLARSMRERSKSEFNLDRLQPDWLPTQIQRRLVILIPAMLSGLFGGLLVYGLVANLDRGGRFVGLLSGLAVGLVAVSGGRASEPVKQLRWQWLGLGGALAVGLGGGGLRGGLVFGLVAVGGGWIYELVRRGEAGIAPAAITPVEPRCWSWSGLRRGVGAGLRYGLAVGLAVGLAAGLAVGLAAGLIDGLRYGLRGGLPAGLGVALIVGLIMGLDSGLVVGLTDQRVTPNEGIRRSARHGLAIGLGPALIGGLGGGLVFGLVYGPRLGLVYGLVYGLAFGLMFGLEFGGIPCLRHLALRGLLVFNGVAPWRYVRFLDDATKRLLLRRRGASYIFVHPLLLTYFAER